MPNAIGRSKPVWISEIEHPAVLASAQHHLGRRVTLIPVNQQGVINLDWINDHSNVTIRYASVRDYFDAMRQALHQHVYAHV